MGGASRADTVEAKTSDSATRDERMGACIASRGPAARARNPGFEGRRAVRSWDGVFPLPPLSDDDELDAARQHRREIAEDRPAQELPHRRAAAGADDDRLHAELGGGLGDGLARAVAEAPHRKRRDRALLEELHRLAEDLVRLLGRPGVGGEEEARDLLHEQNIELLLVGLLEAVAGL